MGLLDALTAAFINTFGITQPTEATRRRASLFILGMLILVLALLVGVTIVVYRVLHV